MNECISGGDCYEGKYCQCVSCKKFEEKDIWTLISPSGVKFTADSPLKCCREEQRTRIPAEVAIERVIAAINLCDLCQEDVSKFIIAKNTPADLSVCSTCMNTIFNTPVYSNDEKKVITPKSEFMKHIEKSAEIARNYPAWKQDCIRK